MTFISILAGFQNGGEGDISHVARYMGVGIVCFGLDQPMGDFPWVIFKSRGGTKKGHRGTSASCRKVHGRCIHSHKKIRPLEEPC